MNRVRHAGFALLPVVVLIGVLAAVAFAITRDGAMSTALVRGGVEADELVYVTESGLRHARWRADASACGGDLVLPSKAFGRHAYSATVTTGSTATLLTLDVDRDAWVRSDRPTENKGADDELHVRNESVGTELALLHFDLSSVAAGARIQSAVAWLHVTGQGQHAEGPLSVHRITAEWTEGGVTWDSFASGYDATPLANIAPQPSGNAWVRIDLTSQVQAWVNGEPNQGVLLAPTHDGIHAKFTARSGPAADRPRLEVVVGAAPASPAVLQVTGVHASGATRTVDQPGEPVMSPVRSWTLQPLASDSRDTWIDEANPTGNHDDGDTLRVSGTASASRVALLEFDLSNLPAGAEIRSARLSLHHKNGSGAAVAVDAHRVTEDWRESSATWQRRMTWVDWDTAGGDYDPTAVATTVVGPGTLERHEWDLTPLVRDWVSGAAANEGVLLRTAQAETSSENFDSSDGADASLHPRLEVDYTCECGLVCQAPAGSGSVLMIVSNPFAPEPSDVAKRALFQSWGYTVNLFDDGSSQFWYDLGIGTNDVLYVSGTAVASSIGNRLDGADVGIVNENPAMVGALGFASSAATPTGVSIQIVDPTHYVTQALPPGVATIYRDTMRGSSLSGSAPGLVTLAAWGGAGALAVLDTGAPLGGGMAGQSAANRRVHLPIAGGEALDLARVNSNGWVLVQRALQWASGDTGPMAAGPSLWLATEQDVSGSGAPGLDDWTDGDVLEFGEPDFVLEPAGTAGTFSRLTRLDDFGSNVEIDAMHRVDTAIRVGELVAMELLPGDLLLSTAGDETLSSDNTLTVRDEDVFVFRPTVEGDYGSGSFTLLLDGSAIHGGDTTALTLVEKRTDVGGRVLARGEFLIADDDEEAVYAFQAISVGQGTTVGARMPFLPEESFGFGSGVAGLDLTEDDVNIGGQPLPAGTLLVTLENDDAGVGDNGLAVDSSDVFALDLTFAGLFPTAAVASAFFDGSAVSFDQPAEHLFAVSLTRTTTLAAARAPVAHWPLDDGAGARAEDVAGEHDGTLESGPSWTDEGQLDGALVFDGNDDAVSVAHDEALAFDEALTIAAWLRHDPSTIGGTHGVVSKEPVGTNEGYWLRVQAGQLWLGIGGELFSPGIPIATGEWTHVAATFDESLGEVRMYIDGAAVLVASTTVDLAPNGDRLLIGSNWEGFKSWEGALDDVRLYDVALGDDEIAALATPPSDDDDPPGGGGGGGATDGVAYLELHQGLSASGDDEWLEADLGAFGVPGNAVVEVAVTNSTTGRERWGGVRAVGSDLERRFRLHEAESGGVDVVVMHAQVDASARVELYADKRDEVAFTLLGYWTGVDYVEHFEEFDADGSGSWRVHDLSSYGVPGSAVAELAMSNDSSSNERSAGARPHGTDLARTLDLQEAEDGGVDVATLMVPTSAAGAIDVYAESDGDVEFTLLGYWSTPPGTYYAAAASPLKTPGGASWADAELGRYGVPGGAVAQLAIANPVENGEAEQGVRRKGSNLQRTLVLHEAEGGGNDLASAHVNTSGEAVIQAFSDGSDSIERFALLGWWVLDAP